MHMLCPSPTFESQCFWRWPPQARMIAGQIRAAFSNWKAYMGSGEVVPEYSVLAHLEEPLVSRKFQWLPADITVDSHGGVKILSYINNMHPEWHASLYAATALLLERMIPVFERVLATVVAQKGAANDYCIASYRDLPQRFQAPPTPRDVSLRGRTLQVRRR